MHPVLSHESVVELRSCLQCKASFPITDKDMEFYDKISPVFAEKKYSIPAPTLCPDCRMRRRLAWRNERKLYKRTCDATGKSIIALHSPDKQRKVYHQEFWWGDGWDPLSYGRDFDFSRPFFDQFKELLSSVPLPNLHTDYDLNINSEYINFSGASKNCYLVFENGDCEDDYYCYHIYSSKDCIDCLGIFGCNVCHECVDCSNCANVFYALRSEDCRDSQFIYNCKGCQNCFACSNLSNKRYYIHNQPHTKSEYEKKLSELMISYNTEDFARLVKASVHRDMDIIGSENSSGNALKDCQNTKSSWYSGGMKDSAYVSFFIGSSDVYDCHSW